MASSWLARLAPTSLMLLVYSIVTTGALLIGTYGNWIDQVVDSQIRANIIGDISGRTNEFIALVFDNSGSTAFVVSFLFWLVIGSLVYMVAWIILGFLKDILSEIEVSLVYVHPRSFTENKHWLGFVIHYLLRASAFLVLIGYSALAIYVLWPALLTQFSFGLLTLTVQSLLQHALLSVILAVTALHVFVLLIQLLMWRRSVDYWLKWNRTN